MRVTSTGVIRRNPDERAKIVEAFTASGLSQRQFCEREGISAWSLRQWLKEAGIPSSRRVSRERDPKPINNDKSKFIEISNPLPGADSVEVELSLPGGVSLRIRR